MCGIVGYTGHRQAQNVLLHGLERLEYRGYDSAGIAVMDDGNIRLVKAKGRLEHLKEKLPEKPLPGCIGIGHTRWATHGEPSDLNAHPHTDEKGDIVIVHNGIIENHVSLRAALKAKGCVFSTQTDTEVIVHLLHTIYDGDMLRTIRRAMEILEGSYALCILTRFDPDTLYCVRKDSPLIIGIGEHETLVASDIPAMLAYTRTFQILEDQEIAVVRQNSVRLYDSCSRLRELSPIQVDWDIDSAEKGGYPHFMLKEIWEEPDALRKTFTMYTDDSGKIRHDVFPVNDEEARSLRSITIVACGTAYHAGMIGKYIIEHLARIPVHVDIASEFRYRKPILDSCDVLLAISQSGETADTQAALREGRRLGAKVLALTNVIGSTIAREAAPDVMYTYAGAEIAVASTKAYVTQVEVLILLALDLAWKRGLLPAEELDTLVKHMAMIPKKAECTLAGLDVIRNFAMTHADPRQVFYIGRGTDYALAQEASLKLKEVSYIHSEAYAAGELKHGAIALIEPGVLVCALLTQPDLAGKTLSNILETRSRGATVLVVCTESLREKAISAADVVWVIPDNHPLLTPLPAIIPMQLLAYFMAVSRGCDVDKPRNLAKSVTVE